jgi:hypothetical protein
MEMKQKAQDIARQARQDQIAEEWFARFLAQANDPADEKHGMTQNMRVGARMLLAFLRENGALCE